MERVRGLFQQGYLENCEILVHSLWCKHIPGSAWFFPCSGSGPAPRPHHSLVVEEQQKDNKDADAKLEIFKKLMG